jgi:organic radical activating enzyme
MDYGAVKQKLDGVGCGFCLAKWTQVTMHLGLGMTHSCHHPAPHKIPLNEIKRNPKALHNTRFKKQKRKEMLDGKRPDECNFCWNVEDNSNSFSDRTFKSAEPWSLDQFDKIKNLDFREDYNPRYVEVSFSNTCNLKCAYCGPQYSSKWVEEIEKHGAYDTETRYNNLEDLRAKNEMPYKHSEDNPYVEAFWKWWPELYRDLHTFRITGGEPLLSKDTFKVLDYISEHWEENPNLSLAINTNLSVPKKLMDKLLEKAKDLTENNKVKELILFTSVEATGAQAEYSRYGLNYDYFWENIDRVLTELPKVTINIMAAFNALSVFTYGDLIDRVFEYKKKYHSNDRYWGTALQLDTSYIRWPSHLSIKILEQEHKELILKAAEKALYYGLTDEAPKRYGFSVVEINKIKRTYDYANAKSHGEFRVDHFRKEFCKFIKQYDERRDVVFTDTFPELKEFYAKYSE